MADSNFKCGPQVGPREAGESHPSVAAEGSPSYSGGGKSCFVGRRRAGLREHDTTCDPNTDSESAYDMDTDDFGAGEGDSEAPSGANTSGEDKWRAKKLPEVRVVLTRSPDLESEGGGKVPSVPKPQSALASRATYQPPWRKKRSYAIECSPDSDTETTAAASTSGGRLANVAKRGRGRPPTTGKYVGVGKARELLTAAINREQQLEAEEEAERMASALQATRRAHLEATAKISAPPAVDITERPAAELSRLAVDSLAAICDVAAKSKNLKGGFVRTLKQSADNLKLALTELGSRTKSDEVARLEAANARLAGELAALREEVAQLRRQPTVAPQTDTSASIRELLEEASRRSIEQFGTMLNARLEAIECRLLPAPSMRPALASDRRVAAAAAPVTPVAPKGSQARQAPRATAGKKKKRKKRATMAAREAASTSVPASVPVPPAPLNEGSWSDAVRRRPGRVPPNSAPAKSKRRKPRSPRVPRSAAVTMTMHPEAAEIGVTYASLIEQAKGQIDLGSLGLGDGDIRFRTTATQARMFQIYGEDSSQKADALAKKLGHILSPDLVRISRPIKRCGIRITGLDDSATAREVVQAVAKEGGCDAGDISASSGGASGSIWLGCPVAAAKKLAQVGRVRVGWVSARITLLDPRPLRCFRCLEPGHMGALCKTGTDRSGLCYRCGEPGHLKRSCTAEPRCMVCVAAGRPTAHILGGKGCPTTVARKASDKGPRVPRPAARAQEDMDVAPT